MNTARSLAAVLFVTSVCLTSIMIIYSASGLIFFEAPLLVLLTAVIFFAYIIGFRKMPRLTWVMMLIVFSVLSFNLQYIYIVLGRTSTLFFISSAIVNLAGIVLSIAGLSIGSAKRARKKDGGGGLLVEVHPKKKNYVASLNASTYHTPDCRLAKRIKNDSMVYFVSKGEAEGKKYIPCKLCID